MRSVLPLILLAALLTVGVPPAAAGGGWTGPDGETLPFRGDEEILAFLRGAEVEKVKVLKTGINRPVKVLLTKDGVAAHAIFRTVDVEKERFVKGSEVYLDFHDSYVYECAAYEMSRLLGLDNVPPCVARRLWGERGSLQLWIEDTMSEADRRGQGIAAPSPLAWVRQCQTLRVFDALIRNFDRHQRNILIDGEWKLWLIDHGRSFHKSPRIDKIERLVWCDRGMWEKLRALDKATLVERTGDYLDPLEIDCVLRRRDAIVRHFEERIAAIGENVVLYSKSDPLPADVESHPDYPVASSTEDIPPSSLIAEVDGGG